MQQNIDISSQNDGLGDPLRNAFDKTQQNFTELYNTKVDKVGGQGLTDNNYTDADLLKLDGIEAGAEANVQSSLLQADDSADDYIIGKEILSNIVNTPDMFTALGTISKIEDEVTVSTGFYWRIFQAMYSNTVPFVFEIELEDDGYNRKDIIVATSSSEFIIIPGESSLGANTAVQPLTPLGTILLTVVDVFGDEIEDTTPPVSGNLYVEKEFYAPQTYNGTGVLNAINMDSKKSNLAFIGATTQFHSIQKNSYNYFSGQPFTIDNRQSVNILLKHNNGTGNILLWFPSLSDFILKAGFKAIFIFNQSAFRYEYSGEIISGTENEITVSNGSIGISPNYTTALNAYADSKISTTITDGVTNSAPNQNAVFDRFSLTEDKVEYLQTNEFDFKFNTAPNFMFSGLSQATGTISSEPVNPGHSDKFMGASCWLHKGHVSNSNSGYRTSMLANRYIYPGSVMFMVMRPVRLTNTYIRAGMQVSESIAPFVDNQNMVVLEIINNEMRFKTSLMSTTSSAPVTLLNTNWLYILIEVLSMTEIRCRVKNSIGGTAIMDVTLTTNLPVSTENSIGVVGIQDRFIWASYAPTADATEISAMARMSHFQQKPNFLKSY